YYVSRSVQRHLPGDSLLVRRGFRAMADAIRRVREEGDDAGRDRLVRDFAGPDKVVQRALLEAAGGVTNDPETSRRLARMFIETCLSLEELDRSSDPDGLSLRSEWSARNFLLGHLLGFRASVPGLDELFGGGGLLLRERASQRRPTERGPSSETIELEPGGRIIAVRGRFGTGKTILALTLAGDVRRRGGLAVVVPLEQPALELAYYAEEFGILGEQSFRLLEDFPESQRGDDTRGKTKGRSKTDAPRTASGGEKADGSLYIVNTASALKDIHQLIAAIVRFADATKDHALRVLVIDPVNSLVEQPDRSGFAEMIRVAKAHGLNLILVVESSAGAPGVPAATARDPAEILPNIADTVIDFASAREYGHEQRYIQIVKSRFQRELPGRHPMSIRPNKGISIAPSSSGALSYYLRGPKGSRVDPLTFGWPELDAILGPEPFVRSDALALRGPISSLKTPLGLQFLGAGGASGPSALAHSLVITVRGNAARPEQLEAGLKGAGVAGASPEILALPGGMVQPGRLLQLIQDRFAESRRKGKRYERVLVTSVGRWDLMCPFVENDPVFGSALVDILRREGVTALFLCEEEAGESKSFLQRAIIDEASVVIDLRRVEFHGRTRITARVVRTRTMQHSNDWHDVSMAGNLLSLHLSLLRFDPGGTTQIKPKLLLHKETKIQEEHNLEIERALKFALTQEVELISENHAGLLEALQLEQFAEGSELQILQLDEFQLPNAKNSAHLASFQLEQREADAWAPDLRERVVTADRVIAFPYLRNVALLTVHAEHPKLAGDTTWAELAGYARELPIAADGRVSLYFDFPQTGENYNCLFFEIALEYLLRAGKPTELPSRGLESFQDWMHQTEIRKALATFRVLAAPARVRARAGAGKDQRGLGSAAGAMITRQWYTTLRETPQDDWAKFEVRPLPGRVCVNGDWFLAVPSQSAVPSVGAKIIRFLTSPHWENQRMLKGVGLPVDAAFYADPARLFPQAAQVKVPRIKQLVESARKRSSVVDYCRLTPILTHHLLELLDGQAAASDDDIAPFVDRLLTDCELALGATSNARELSRSAR
ncbi:MAG TPA: ATPase domain-containing protein, partial [Polyangiaceae bacterium]|nr:ATPase domain-containing protein [Polyangiaceae bacterium]